MSPGTGWQDVVLERLALFGHRNWIVVADAAYPAQSAEGIETITSGCDLLQVLSHILSALEASRHVDATVYIDRELAFVGEPDAPGVSGYRCELKQRLSTRTVHELLHEEIIAKLDAAAHMFRILIVKTQAAIPYTSVFFELECGYWIPEAERRLRAAVMRQSAPK